MFRVKMLLATLVGSLLLLGAAQAEDHSTVPTDPFDVRPLLSGQQAPSFTAVAANGEQFVFDPTKRDKPAVLVFYRGGWCPYCNLHFKELREAEAGLLEAGVELLFLSADSPQKLAEGLTEGEPVNYHLLSDNSMSISRAFGIAFKVDSETVEKYKKFGIDLEEASGYQHHQLPAPAIFIVDTDGMIKFQYVNPDYSVRLSPEVLVAAAKTMPEYRVKRG